MKIGILTFHNAVNHGAALQAAALARVLGGNGDDVRFVGHRCAAVVRDSAVFDLKKLSDLRYTAAHLINLPIALKRQRRFADFDRKYITVGSDSPGDYDLIVAGSDQIWNYKLTAEDMFYFLDFEKKGIKKAAYAASFGLSQLPEEFSRRIAPLLRDFDSLSVREATAAKLVRESCGLDAPVVLDPTLLLDRTQWEEMADPGFKEKGYIFVYTIFKSDSLWDFAYDLSRRTGLPIRTISYSRIHRKKAIYTFDAGPSQWLSHMLGADYVVTNSFHGMAFSVNFRKQFYYELPPEHSGVGSRLSDMAVRYGLEDRRTDCARFDSVVDWSAAEEKLERDKEASMEFIRTLMRN